MGAFFGVGYVRTDDRDKVRSVLEEIARKKKTRFLLAPPLHGWVGVYPENGGQDPTISKTLARRLTAKVLHVIDHDDDVFCYFYYDGDSLVDEYNSRPDYFHAVSDRERQKQRGRPDLLADLLPDQNSLEALRVILHQAERPLFVSETLEQFAQLLRLPNALTSYDYMMDEETEGIEGWEEFLHVPDLSAQKAAKRA